MGQLALKGLYVEYCFTSHCSKGGLNFNGEGFYDT